MFINLIQGRMATQGHLAACGWMPQTPHETTHPVGKVVAAGEVTEDGMTVVLSKTALSGAGILASHFYEIDAPAMLRLDEVCFPVGAVAHRHTHAGSGIRYLARGALRLEADDHTQTINAGECWFEAAHSPVRAVALQTQGVTSFLRAMVIPISFEGKSTFALTDPADASLPRLQVTHRHIDLPL